MDIKEAIFRLFLAALLGGALGFEREKHGRVAGFRTHVLVTVGSALIMMVSLHLYDIFKIYHTANYASGVDPSRIASMVIAGVGFLGAGTILKSKGSIWGLTTAACLWMAAALGLSVGCGYYIPALTATLIALCTLALLKHLGRVIKKDWYHTIGVEMSQKTDGLKDIKQILDNEGFTILKVSFRKDIPQNEMIYTIYLRSQSRMEECLIEDVAGLEGVKRVTCD